MRRTFRKQHYPKVDRFSDSSEHGFENPKRRPFTKRFPRLDFSTPSSLHPKSSRPSDLRKTSWRLSSFPHQTKAPEGIPKFYPPAVDPNYIDYIQNRKRSQPELYKLPFGHPRYKQRHPSEAKLPVDRLGERAAYGTARTGKAIYGPADWDQFQGTWSKIGDHYKQSVDPNISMLPHEQTFLNRHGFFLEARLGSGGYGTVYRVRSVTTDSQNNLINTYFACKILSLVHFKKGNRTVQQCLEKLKFEANLLSDLNHPNIIKSESVFNIYDEVSQFSQPIRLCQFLELCDGDLRSLLNSTPQHRMDELDSLVWFIQIANGLKYLHDRRIAHLDIKPENILYKTTATDTVYKLTDFGLALKYGPNSPMQTVGWRGTKQYMAPEMDYPLIPVYEVKPADIYSLGLCLAESMAGGLKFNKILRAIHRGQTSRLSFTPEVIFLITWMTYDFVNRPTIDEVLNSDWVMQMI